jgi:hypothetical protein
MCLNFTKVIGIFVKTLGVITSVEDVPSMKAAIVQQHVSPALRVFDFGFRERLGRFDKQRFCVLGNDVYGMGETLGFDMAVNAAVTEIDKIRGTAVSMKVFIVEVMGKRRGFLAAAVA